MILRVLLLGILNLIKIDILNFNGFHISKLVTGHIIFLLLLNRVVTFAV